MLDVVFFAPEMNSSSGGVFYSQIVEQILFLEQNGFRCGLITSCLPDCSKANREEFGNLIQGPVMLVDLANPPNAIGTYKIARKAFQQFRDEILNLQPRFVYYRNFFSALGTRKLFKKLGILSHYDMRGLVVRETFFKKFGKQPFYAPLLERFEYRQVFQADRTTCVSNNMADLLREATGKSVDGAIASCANTSRFNFNEPLRNTYRNQLGWSQNTVHIYSGGLSRWQRIDEAIQLFSRILERDASARFIFMIKNNHEKIRAQLKQAGITEDKFRVFGASPSEVPNWLYAADFGVVLRHQNIINKVASPVKIGEYLLSGLKLIVSNDVGDTSQDVVKHDLGIDLSEDELQNVINNGFENGFILTPPTLEERNSIRNYALARFDRGSYLDDYQRLYSSRDKQES